MIGRYFRFTSDGSSVNSANHWIEIQIFDANGKNVALGKGLFWYSNADPGALELFRNPANVTDNNTSGNYFDMGPGKQSLIIDIGEVKNITHIKMWRYYADQRIYYGTVVEASIDNVNYETVFSADADGTYKESATGKTVTLPPSQSYTGAMTQLEYIQSTGSQYINTEIVPTGSTITEVKFSVQEIKNFGPHILSASNWFSAFPRKTDDTTKKNVFAVNVGSGFLYLDYTSRENELYTIRTIPGDKVVINKTEIQIGSGTYNDTTPLIVMAYGGSPTDTTYNAKAKVHSCKIWNNGILVRSFVPVQLDIGECGLFDLVSGRFYCNLGTGELLPGPIAILKKYILRSGSTLYTVADGALAAISETAVSASVFQTYGVDDLPDGALLAMLTDPEVLYWQDSTDELPTLSLTVKGTPPLPQMFTSEPMDLTHESIAGISRAAVDASADVRFAISFDDGASWKAFDGSSWFNVSDTAPGMLASTMNAITAGQWAEVVQLTAYRLRFWLPNVTASVKSVVIHYINP